MDMPSTSPQIPLHIAVLSCDVSQNEYQKKILKALCAPKKKHAHSVLQEIKDVREKLTDLAALPELSQTEANKRIINPSTLYTWVRSPDGKYYQVKIPIDLPAGTKREIHI